MTTGNFINIGERTNVTGSARFRKLIMAGDYPAAVEVARSQVENGAQIIDVNMDEGLLDGKAAMREFLNLIAAEPDISRVPVMIDSSKFEVIEEGLKCVQGRPIVNSISLKEGEAEFLEHARTIRRFGAAVVVMAFDEGGQAETAEHKFQISERAYHLLVDKAGFDPWDIVFDPNIFAVATGIEEHNDYAVAFFEAVRMIKQRLPYAATSGGLSNVSFSFRGNDSVREAMHSAFLYHAIHAGLDMAIVNAGQITVYDDIPEELRERVEDVLLNRRDDATERVLAIADKYRGSGEAQTKSDPKWREGPVEDQLEQPDDADLLDGPRRPPGLRGAGLPGLALEVLEPAALLDVLSPEIEPPLQLVRAHLFALDPVGELPRELHVVVQAVEHGEVTEREPVRREAHPCELDPGRTGSRSVTSPCSTA